MMLVVARICKVAGCDPDALKKRGIISRLSLGLVDPEVEMQLNN